MSGYDYFEFIATGFMMFGFLMVGALSTFCVWLIIKEMGE